MIMMFARVLVGALWPAGLVYLANLLLLEDGMTGDYIFSSIDSFLHFFGGVAMSYAGLYFLTFFQKSGRLPSLPDWFRVVCAGLFAVMMAVVWEWHEFALDYFWQTNTQPSVFDTMKDLFLGFVGGVVGGFFLKKVD